jgi:hypothetical protein
MAEGQKSPDVKYHLVPQPPPPANAIGGKGHVSQASLAAVEIRSDANAIKRPVDALGAHLTSDVQRLAAKPNPPADRINSYCLAFSIRDVVLPLVFGPQFAGLDGADDH